MEQTLLAEKYRLLEELGRGGMGSVWRAEHLALSAPIAVKLMAPAIAEAPEALARFHREAQAAAALRSPHVVQILDHGVDAKTGTPFIVMELLEGESLASRLARLGQLEPAATSRIITQVARALTKAHAAGIVHRDLKPDNIFLVNNDDEEIAKVLDFGIAKSETHALAAATVTGALMGTAYYMSPEQISGSKELDFRTDLWALGVIAHECLLGRRPFEAETIGAMVLRICTQPIERPSLFGSVPEGFDQWFEQAVAREPERRFQSARELADTFKAVCRASLLLTESVDFTTGKTLLSDTGSDRLPKASTTDSASSTANGWGAPVAHGSNTTNPVSHSTTGDFSRPEAVKAGVNSWLLLGLVASFAGLLVIGAWSLWRGPTSEAPGAAALSASNAALLSSGIAPVERPATPAPEKAAEAHSSPVVAPLVPTGMPAPLTSVDVSSTGAAGVARNETLREPSSRGSGGTRVPVSRAATPPAAPLPAATPPAIAPTPVVAAPPPPVTPKPQPVPPAAPSPFDGVLRTRK